MTNENPFRPPRTTEEIGRDEISRYTGVSRLSETLLVTTLATLAVAFRFWEDGPIKGTLARMLMPVGALQFGCLLASLIYRSAMRKSRRKQLISRVRNIVGDRSTSEGAPGDR